MKSPANTGKLESTYDERFFRQHDPSFYGVLAGAIIESCDGGSRSVVDVGCGHGYLVEAFHHLGLEAWGIEGSSAARGLWPVERLDHYRLCDLGARPDPGMLPATDVVCSFEVAEHINGEHAGPFVRFLLAHNPGYLVFGAATAWQDLGRNPTHVNEQPFGYWIEMLSRQGYAIDILRTVSLKNRLFDLKRSHGVKWWYPKNTMVFVPAATLAQDPTYLQRLAALDSGNLKWRVRSGNPAFNTMAERDHLEYLLIVERAIADASRRLARSSAG